nr:unnamed protein product [Callosobruchus analis]
MSEIQIEKISEILQVYVGQGWTITNLEVVPLLPKGENYCATVLGVSASLRSDEVKQTKVIRAIAKCSVSTGMFKIGFVNIYMREVYFYTRIISCLKEFARRHCKEDVEDMFPEFYGCSEQPEKATADSVLLIEDLTTKGFKIKDRFVGYDYDEIKVVLKTVAFFHGVPLAMKIKEPISFERNIKALSQIDLFPPEVDQDRLWEMVPNLEEDNETSTKLLLQILEDYCLPQKYINKMADFLASEYLALAGNKLHTVSGTEPFNTLVHNDVWINNIMHIMRDGSISETKLIDFQMYRYNHPAKDLMHLLFTSVKHDVLKEHLDYLIDFYYKELIANLLRMDCDVSRFDKQHFLEDINMSMGAIFGHIIYMIIFVVFGKRKPSSENFELPSVNGRMDDIAEEARNKFCFLVEQVFKRKWCTGIDSLQ